MHDIQVFKLPWCSVDSKTFKLNQQLLRSWSNFERDRREIILFRDFEIFKVKKLLTIIDRNRSTWTIENSLVYA